MSEQQSPSFCFIPAESLPRPIRKPRQAGARQQFFDSPSTFFRRLSEEPTEEFDVFENRKCRVKVPP